MDDNKKLDEYKKIMGEIVEFCVPKFIEHGLSKIEGVFVMKTLYEAYEAVNKQSKVEEK